MRALVLAALLGLAAPAPAVASDEPAERLIVEMALLRMVERLDVLAIARFGPSVVHSQPGGRYWAVVGRVASGAFTGDMRQHIFVVAVRLVCEAVESAECWRLEKLALDNQILFDRGDPL